MKPGPKPTPTIKLAQRGSWRAKHRADYKARIIRECPSMPSWLNDITKREWRRIIPLLKNFGILRKADKTTLEMYCSAYAEWRDYEAEIAKLESRFIKQPSGRVCPHPLIGLRDRAFDRLRKIAAELGLSPTSRTGLNIYQGPAVDDKLTRFFKRDA